MCDYYDPRLTDACAEDDALEVQEKSKANFCDYFKPSDDKYSPDALEAEVAAIKAKVPESPASEKKAAPLPAISDNKVSRSPQKDPEEYVVWSNKTRRCE